MYFLNLIFPTMAMLVGFAAFVAALINLLKLFGLPDGLAPRVSMILHLVMFGVVVYFAYLGRVEVVTMIDAQLGIVATFLVLFGTFVSEIGLTKFIHERALRGLPVIGMSYSQGK